MNALLKLILFCLVALSVSACASMQILNEYRAKIKEQCERDAELLEMTVKECYDELNIR